jgi:hypothetical protein
MTTYAYPITLSELALNQLIQVLKKQCNEWEKEGNLVYDPVTKKPMGTFVTILEIMNEAKESNTVKSESYASKITFTLTDYLFIPLENFLKQKCQEYKDKTGNDPFNPITGEPQFSFASMLEATRFAVKSATLNSYSSLSYDAPVIKLWSPKN